MKIGIPKESDNVRMNTKALLPLVEDESLYALDKSNSVSYELRTIPGDPNSAKYKFQLRVLTGTEPVRAILKWQKDVQKVVTGLNITTLAAGRPIMETAMRTGPMSLFHACLLAEATAAYDAAMDVARAADHLAGDTTASDAVVANGVNHYRHFDHLEVGLRFVVQQLLPQNVLARVKRTLRRECRKPMEMKVRTYYQQILRINQEEIPALPPFQANQNLTSDEVTDILLYGTPKSWQKEMDKMGFDPMLHEVDEVVSFMENIESSEERSENQAMTIDKGLAAAQNKKKKSSGSNGKSRGDLFCLLHGHGNHTTNDCTKLKDKAKEIKSSYTKSGSSSGYKKSSNKTWSRKAEEGKKNASNDLAAILKKAVKKEVASVAKKRKSEDDKDFNVAEALKDFNYDNELGNLKIDSDDDFSDGEISC